MMSDFWKQCRDGRFWANLILFFFLVASHVPAWHPFSGELPYPGMAMVGNCRPAGELASVIFITVLLYLVCGRLFFENAKPGAEWKNLLFVFFAQFVPLLVLCAGVWPAALAGTYYYRHHVKERQFFRIIGLEFAGGMMMMTDGRFILPVLGCFLLLDLTQFLRLKKPGYLAGWLVFSGAAWMFCGQQLPQFVPFLRSAFAQTLNGMPECGFSFSWVMIPLIAVGVAIFLLPYRFMARAQKFSHFSIMLVMLGSSWQLAAAGNPAFAAAPAMALLYLLSAPSFAYRWRRFTGMRSGSAR